jgi:trans-aconitate methyltransferase
MDATMPQWNPADYSKHSSVQQAWARELIGKLKLQPAERLLDIGCGDGKVTAELAGLLPAGSVVGIDNSAEMIRFARLEFPTVRCPNLRFEVADARDLKFEEDFDAVFSNAALHWIVGHEPVLAGVARALRPGGRVLLQMGGKGNATPVIAVLEEMIQANKWHPYFVDDFAFPYGFHGPDEYAPWLTRAGLIALRIELIPRDMVHKGPDQLAGWIRTTWLPYTHRVPIVLRDAFIHELVDRYVDRFPLDANGNTHVQMMRLEVEAKKKL